MRLIMRKLFLTTILTLCMIIGFVNCVSAATYTDTEHWAKHSIDYVSNEGYFVGVGSDKFAPDNKITRGEFVTALARYDGVNLDNYKLSPFGDIAEYQYYTKSIIWAYEKNIVKGVSENTFEPDSYITREQVAMILYNYCNLNNSSLSIEDIYKDNNDISDWAKDAVAAVTQNNLFVGYDNKFNPKSNLTRAEAAVLFARMDGENFELYSPPKEKLTYIGTFSNTFYCPCSRCNGNSHGITASGAKLTPYLSVAVDKRVIPLGTKLYIEFENENTKTISGYYMAHDTGGAIKGNKIDVCVNSHSEAYYYGIGKCKVYIVEE